MDEIDMEIKELVRAVEIKYSRPSYIINLAGGAPALDGWSPEWDKNEYIFAKMYAKSEIIDEYSLISDWVFFSTIKALMLMGTQTIGLTEEEVFDNFELTFNRDLLKAGFIVKDKANGKLSNEQAQKVIHFYLNILKGFPLTRNNLTHINGMRIVGLLKLFLGSVLNEIPQKEKDLYFLYDLVRYWDNPSNYSQEMLEFIEPTFLNQLKEKLNSALSKHDYLVDKGFSSDEEFWEFRVNEQSQFIEDLQIGEGYLSPEED